MDFNVEVDETRLPKIRGGRGEEFLGLAIGRRTWLAAHTGHTPVMHSARGRRPAEDAQFLDRLVRGKSAKAAKAETVAAETKRLAEEAAARAASAAEEERQRKIAEEAAAREEARLKAERDKKEREAAELERLVAGKSRKQARREHMLQEQLVEEALARQEAQAAEQAAKLSARNAPKMAQDALASRLSQTGTAAVLHRISQSSGAMAELARRDVTQAAQIQAAAILAATKQHASAMASKPLAAAAAAAAVAAANAAIAAANEPLHALQAKNELIEKQAGRAFELHEAAAMAELAKEVEGVAAHTRWVLHTTKPSPRKHHQRSVVTRVDAPSTVASASVAVASSPHAAQVPTTAPITRSQPGAPAAPPRPASPRPASPRGTKPQLGGGSASGGSSGGDNEARRKPVALALGADEGGNQAPSSAIKRHQVASALGADEGGNQAPSSAIKRHQVASALGAGASAAQWQAQQAAQAQQQHQQQQAQQHVQQQQQQVAAVQNMPTTAPSMPTTAPPSGTLVSSREAIRSGISSVAHLPPPGVPASARYDALGSLQGRLGAYSTEVKKALREVAASSIAPKTAPRPPPPPLPVTGPISLTVSELQLHARGLPNMDVVDPYVVFHLGDSELLRTEDLWNAFDGHMEVVRWPNALMTP